MEIDVRLRFHTPIRIEGECISLQATTATSLCESDTSLWSWQASDSLVWSLGNSACATDHGLLPGGLHVFALALIGTRGLKVDQPFRYADPTRTLCALKCIRPPVVV